MLRRPHMNFQSKPERKTKKRKYRHKQLMNFWKEARRSTGDDRADSILFYSLCVTKTERMTRWKRNTCFVLYSVMISSARVLALCCLYSCLLFFHPSLMLDSRLLCLLVWSSLLCSCVHFCISSLHFCVFCSLLLSSSLLSACVVGDCFLGSS